MNFNIKHLQHISDDNEKQFVIFHIFHWKGLFSPEDVMIDFFLLDDDERT